jgi:aspartyl-tRNA(Asn)/glutamyl-tRNA(Gln) amidotransferase subunit C
MNTGSDSSQELDVAYVANLAQLELSPEEQTLFQEQLNRVVDYVHQLNELALEGIEPTAHSIPLSNVLRADEPQAGLAHDAVIANSPAARNGQILVPKINEQF